MNDCINVEWRVHGANVWAVGGEGKADTLILQALTVDLARYVAGLHNAALGKETSELV